MKVLMILAAAAALSLAGCHRDQNAASGSSSYSSRSAASGSSSAQTPRGAATGQQSEGSTDSTTAPKRPSSPTPGK